MLLAYNFTKEFYPIGLSRKLAYFFRAPILQNACLAFLQVLKKICKYVAKIKKKKLYKWKKMYKYIKDTNIKKYTDTKKYRNVKKYADVKRFS